MGDILSTDSTERPPSRTSGFTPIPDRSSVACFASGMGEPKRSPKKWMPRLDITGGGAYDTSVIRAMIDTNVLIAALRSSSGASFQILLAADRGDFEVALSVPLLAEYDDVSARQDIGITIPQGSINAIIGRIAQIAHKQPIYFLWRPILPDPKDDMVLELGIAAGVSHIVTFNRKDFRQAEEFGITVSSPSEFLTLIP